VICASDLNPDAASVAAYADMLAREFQATLTLLQVRDSTKKGDENDLSQFEKALTQLLPKAETSVRALHTLVSDRDPSLEIVAFAKERHADLIVMGAHTAFPGTSHLLRGIAPHVLAEAPCPVMILRQQ
jgi:nucleotide-binding universal stress UspA family protein